MPEIGENAPSKPRRPTSSEPFGELSGAATDRTLSLQTMKTVSRGVATGIRPVKGHDAGHGHGPIEYHDGTTRPYVVQVLRQVVLELGYLGSFHIAIIAI